MASGFVVGDRGLGAAGDTHPAWSIGHAEVGPYLVVGASAIGRLHLAHGQPRDDAFVVRAIGEWLAAAVADGLGSRPFSRFGATYAVESLTAQLLRILATPGDFNSQVTNEGPSEWQDMAPLPYVEPVSMRPTTVSERPINLSGRKKRSALGVLSKPRHQRANSVALSRRRLVTMRQAGSLGWWPVVDRQQTLEKNQTSTGQLDLNQIMRDAFEKTHLGLREHARGLGLELAELGCTALALLFNWRDGRIAVGQVGDGAILGLTDTDLDELITTEDTGDPQATYTLTGVNFSGHLVTRAIDSAEAQKIRAIYLMTDGVSNDLLYSPRTPAFVEWARRVKRNLILSQSPVQAAVGMLNWLATYRVTGSWDDRTLVVITRKEEPNADYQPIAR